MSRESNDKTKYIKYAFPSDFTQLDSILSVDGGGKTIKVNSDDKFRVRPECDLPYKLLSMIYSKKYRFDNFRKLYRKVKGAKDDELFFHHRRNFEWIDYMFHFPGINELLGIKREFHIGGSAEWTDSNSINDKDSILKVIQTPILFLILIELKILDDAFFTNTIVELVNHAITAYKLGKDSNMFDSKQLEWCFEFLLNDSEYFGMNTCYGDNKVTKIEKKVEKIVIDYFKSNDDIKEDFTCEEEKGNLLSFPQYIRPILLGIYEEYECLKSFSPLVGKRTFWSKDKVMAFRGIESETSKTFKRLYMFLHYREESNKLLNFFRNEDMEEFDNIQKEKALSNITEKLISYYTFCIYTLYKVSCEETQYQQLAQDTFERLFSLFLFNQETELLYELVDQLVSENNIDSNLIEIERIGDYFGITRYVMRMISDEGIHAIYCSPGIYHRVNLVKHIVKTNLSIDILQVCYKSIDISSIDRVRGDEQILEEINIINQVYSAAEKNCIYSWFYGKKELSIDDIKEKYQLRKECTNWHLYNNYYEDLYAKIRNVLNIKYESGSKCKFNHNDAFKIAKAIIGKMPDEKRLVHFWVILFSFISEDTLIKAD